MIRPGLTVTRTDVPAVTPAAFAIGFVRRKASPLPYALICPTEVRIEFSKNVDTNVSKYCWRVNVGCMHPSPSQGVRIPLGENGRVRWRTQGGLCGPGYTRFGLLG